MKKGKKKVNKKNSIQSILIREKYVFCLLILVCCILLLTSSYALLSNLDNMDNAINFETGNLNISITNLDDSAIATELSGKFPESDYEGMQNATPIVFTLTNTGTINIGEYDVKLVSDDLKESTLDERFIKYSISLDGGINYYSSEDLKISNNVIYTGYNLGVSESKTIYLKVWIDESADSSSLNKVYYGSIKVDLFQKVQIDDIYITKTSYKESLDVDLTNSKVSNHNITTLNNTISLSSTNKDSYLTYDVTLYNNTSSDVKFYSLENLSSDNDNVEYAVEGLKSGDVLKSKEEVVVSVKFHYKDYTLAESNLYNSILKFIFVKKYDGKTLYDVLADKAVSDSKPSQFVTNPKGIQFDQEAGPTNGYGLYTISTTRNDEYPIHYYRGLVKTNNIILNNICFKMVRTTATGGTKLIYNGTPVNGSCDNTGAASYIDGTYYNFNPASYFSAIGYMKTKNNYSLGAQNSVNTLTNGVIFANDVEYKDGKYILSEDRYLKNDELSAENINDNLKTHHYTCLSTDENACTRIFFIYMIRETRIFYVILTGGATIESYIEETFTNSPNDEPSNAKDKVDKWYRDNMTNFTDYLEDTVWCNDRSIANLGGWDKNNDLLDDPKYKINFGAYARLVLNKTP